MINRTSGLLPFTLIVFLAGTAVACADSPPITDASLEFDEEVVLEIGQVVSLDSGRLTVGFVEVAQDSRCPTDVVCVWEGNARVVLESVVGGVERSFALDTSLNGGGVGSTTVDGYTVHLKAVDPAPVSDQAIPSEAYRITVRVTRD